MGLLLTNYVIPGAEAAGMDTIAEVEGAKKAAFSSGDELDVIRFARREAQLGGVSASLKGCQCHISRHCSLGRCYSFPKRNADTPRRLLEGHSAES